MKTDSSIISQRRPTRSSKVQDADMQNIARFNTTNSLHLEPPSQQQNRRVIQSLQQSLKKQKQQHQQIKEKYLQYQKRTIEREKQFHKILSNLDANVAKHTESTNDIQKTYQSIIEKFSQSEEQVRQNTEKRYKENLSTMERRIKDIIFKMENQMKKNHKLSEGQHEQIRLQISRLEAVALSIDKQNVSLIKENEQLVFKNRLLSEEKKLIIEQLNQKKMMARKYFELSRVPSRAISRNSSAGHSQKNMSQSKTISASKNYDNKETLCNTQSFAFELVKSKIPGRNSFKSKNISSLNNSINMFPGNKDYIPSLTLTSMSPNKLRCQVTQQQSRAKDNLTLENNTINSLKQVLSRQKRKKLEYQNELTLIQQKILAIDRIIVDGFIKMKEIDEIKENGDKKNAFSKGYKQIEQLNQNKPADNDWIKRIFDTLKNIISGNCDPNVWKTANNYTLMTSQQVNGAYLMDLVNNKSGVTDEYE